ncbi:hypothetical protein [Nocardia sp. NPDC057455]|uniref:hypothetical protein n=1 Tax=Nocardia sp. NPDC057455 TaxID=3346138 RepID=UPI00366E4C4C
MSYSTNRAGTGRWTAIMRPSVGVLWTDDDTALGFFQAQLSGKVDAAPVQNLIDTAYAAGLTARQAFDQLAAAIGSRIDEGDLDNWRPNRASRARQLPGAMPEPR